MQPRYPLPPIPDAEWRQITIFQYEQMREADAALQAILAGEDAAEAVADGAAQLPCKVLDTFPPAPDVWGPRPRQTA
jgi:hypothetical protein